ncbi:MAG: tetratricopeptide repeat protein [Kiritimatiellae bacterium]|nr:tetratricopeptide repeat protein [Kiritimatiellia bacterium]
MSVKSGFCRYVPVLLLCAAWLAADAAGAENASSNNFLAVASAALEDEMYEIAEENIRQYLELAAGGGRTQTEHIIMLARALRGRKKYPEMLELLVRNRQEAESGHLAGAFAFWLALAFYDNARWEASWEQINGFESRYPGSALIPDAIRLQADVLLKLGRESEAAGVLQRLIGKNEHDTEHVDDRLFLGQVLAGSGRTGEAVAVLEKMLSFPPDTSAGQKCRGILGRIYTGREEWQKARRVYEPLLNQENIPDDYRLQAIEALAEIAASQTNYGEALIILEKGERLLTNPPQKNELGLFQGRLLLKTGKIDEGTALIHNFVRSQTTNALGAEVQIELAQTLLAGGLNEKALVEFQNFLETFAARADLTEAYRGKGTALFNLGRYHEAAAAFGKAGETAGNPEKKAEYLYCAADAFFAGGQFKPAADMYALAAAAASSAHLANMARFQVAECQLQMENLAEAEKSFWEVYDEDPADTLAPRALLRIADILLRQNKLRAAETVYVWINLDYGVQWRPRSIYGRGVIAYRSGRFTEAKDYFADVLRQTGLAGDNEVAAAATYMAGWSCFMLDDPAEARRRFASVVSVYPRSAKAPEALFRLGEHDYNCGHYDSAEKLFRRLADDYPLSSLAADSLFWAGRAALMQNEFKKGRDYFSALIKKYPGSSKKSEARYFQGVALCELGRFDAAILVFNEVIRQSPDHERAAFKKADCQFILGSDESQRYEEAVNSYQFILDRPERSASARLQARYKIGRCLEKLGKKDEALARYLQVVYAYLQDEAQTPSGNLWFARAAFNAAAIMEDKEQWRQAVNIYQRVVEADIPAGNDARERIDALRAKHWLLFY